MFVILYVHRWLPWLVLIKCYCGESVSGFQAGEGCSGQRWRSLLGEFWWLFLGFQSVYERLDAAFHASGHSPGHWVCRRRGGRASTLGGRPCYQALLVPKLKRRRERFLWVSVGNIPTNVKSAKQRRKKCETSCNKIQHIHFYTSVLVLTTQAAWTASDTLPALGSHQNTWHWKCWLPVSIMKANEWTSRPTPMKDRKRTRHSTSTSSSSSCAVMKEDS